MPGSHLSGSGNVRVCVCVFGINTVIWLFSYLQPQQDVSQHADGVYLRNKKLKSEEIKKKQDRRKMDREVVKATERKRTKSTMSV